MIMSRKVLNMVIVIIMLPLLVGCGTSETPVPTPTSTSLPPTSTPIPPTPALQPFEVTLDEKECIFSGPSEVPTGEYPIFLNNLIEIDKINLIVRYLKDGKTFQDVLELQDEPGENFAMPPWAFDAAYRYSSIDDVNYYILDNSGEYFIYVWRVYEPNLLWLCPPSFQVIEVSSQ